MIRRGITRSTVFGGGRVLVGTKRQLQVRRHQISQDTVRMEQNAVVSIGAVFATDGIATRGERVMVHIIRVMVVVVVSRGMVMIVVIVVRMDVNSRGGQQHQKDRECAHASTNELLDHHGHAAHMRQIFLPVKYPVAISNNAAVSKPSSEIPL